MLSAKLLSAKFYDKVNEKYITLESVIRVAYKDGTWFIAFSTDELPVYLLGSEFDFVWVM